MQDLTRRQMLQASGGITFLALTATEGGHATPSGSSAPMPVFTALPYIQPGAQAATLRENEESLVLAWQTNDRPGAFRVLLKGGKEEITPQQTARLAGEVDDGERRLSYAATLAGLRLNTRYEYRVTLNGKRVVEGYFTTRKPRGTKTRFVAFGDNSYGDIADRMVAYQAYRARPDFVMNTGDLVYEDGRDDEYARYFFPVYNADVASPRVGAPLLRSVPLYTVLANHDVHGKNDKLHPVADFDAFEDSLGYYTNLHLPQNGMEANPFPTPCKGKQEVLNAFHSAAGARYPRTATYSFDYGDAHFLCLDSNLYVNPNHAALQAYIQSDLMSTDASWKFVVFHHPSFNVGEHHYTQQHMRVLSPIFEACGVSIVFHGHEHNYQRTMPLRFRPTDTAGADKVGTKARLVPGVFTLDKNFDGVTRTQPNGVIYLTTGAGGKYLYDQDMHDSPPKRLHPEDGNLDYVSAFVSDRHSLTIVDMDARSLVVRQIDQWGGVVDTFRLTR